MAGGGSGGDDDDDDDDDTTELVETSETSVVQVRGASEDNFSSCSDVLCLIGDDDGSVDGRTDGTNKEEGK